MPSTPARPGPSSPPRARPWPHSSSPTTRSSASSATRSSSPMRHMRCGSRSCGRLRNPPTPRRSAGGSNRSRASCSANKASGASSRPTPSPSRARTWSADHYGCSSPTRTRTSTRATGSTWDDPVRAFADIADGVRKAATEIIWKRGGPFEFGPHQFTDAELAELDDSSRRWTRARLEDLHGELTRSIPSRRVDGNLLIATWSMRSLGRKAIELEECRYYLAAIISAFDVVTLQEVHHDLSELNRLLEILGPDWEYIVTDISEGPMGNLERFAILHYAPRVQFDHVSGEVVLLRKELIDGEQFARKPLIASFRAGEMRFRVCTAHLSYGGQSKKDVAQTAKEADALARHLVRRAARRDPTGIVLSGNLNLRDKDSPVVEALREVGVDLPGELLMPNLALSRSDYHAGAIGFVSPKAKLRLGSSEPNAGAFDFKRALFRPEHLVHYRDAGLYQPPEGSEDDETRFVRWGVLGVSDHLPLWAELKV